MANIIRSFIDELLPVWLKQLERRKEIGMPVEFAMPDSERSAAPTIGDSKQYLIRMYVGEGVDAYPVGDESLGNKKRPVTAPNVITTGMS